MEKTNMKINTNNMIALCHIVDEFDNFEKKLMNTISQKYNKDFVFQVWNISKGKFSTRKAKKFYENNKTVIDTINKYSNIPMFINEIYRWDGNYTENLRFFYKYLINHKEEIPKILELVKKINELGFSEFEFNEKLDFTKETYNAYLLPSDNFDLIYVANPQIIPNYTSNINFTTTDSNYKIKLILSNIPRNEISKFNRKIILNSLLFNSNTLPEIIDIEHTHGQLVRLKEEQKDKISIIKNLFDLNISVLDLEKQFNNTNETISKLDYIKKKNEFVEVLKNMKENLEKLKILSAKHYNNISQIDPQINIEKLENEKTLYLKRKKYSNIDLD